MSQWDKLLLRIYALAKDLRFDEVRKVLERYGYKMEGTSGGSSHFTFRKPGCVPITIPKHEPIKKCYIKIIRDAIEHDAMGYDNAESEVHGDDAE